MSLKSSIMKHLSKGPHSAKQLRVVTGADGKKIGKALDSLEKEKKVKSNKGVWSIKKGAKGPQVEARIVKLAGHFAFASALDGSGDIFIPGRYLKGAMPQDIVSVALSTQPRVPGSREGEVTSILSPPGCVVGTVEKIDGRLVLVPDKAPETPLVIKKSADGGVKEGEKAAGEILERGDSYEEHRVGITMRFGQADSARQCAKAVLYGAGVEKSFSAAVKAEAKQVSAEKITKEEIKNRMDLREWPILTIDSASTKDIDDAICAECTKNGYRLSVHIADVSHYVRGKSPLDEEAYARGTSVYYADSVIPMLPKSLSNGICSLNPGEDRLAFSCLMEMDGDAKVTKYRFKKSVIHSRVQGVYTEVNAIFDKTADEALQKKYAEVAECLTVCEEIYRKLAAARQARGSLDIESDEAELVVDEMGVCVDVKPRTRGMAEKMIEEFMLAANGSAAKFAAKNEIPFVYRVHDKPSAEKIEGLKHILTALGVSFHFDGTVPTQTELAKLLDETRDTMLEIPVHHAVLRSMAKARYEPLPKGHYGLVLADYAHFTSPIRRYPDLAIHRIMGDLVAGANPAQVKKKYKTFAEEASVQSSEREVIATQVERDCDDCYKAEYMHQYIGKIFDGVVTSVVPFGLYVTLPNTVEGLVHSRTLSENRLEAVNGVCLTDPVTGHKWQVGQKVTVQVDGADVSKGNIDFSLV